MKRLILSVVLLGLISPSYAALITRTYSYSAGNTIAADQNNTNETTLYNEINGNLNSANILDGGISTADLADSLITYGKLDSSVQSTFTYVNQLGVYRRPVLRHISATVVDIENNTGTSNETCVQFPNERRCVTENTGSTNKYRRFDITAACTYTSGTEDSGLVGATEATNTWYFLYAVKSQIDASNFVVCGSTVPATQSSYSTLNTMFGANGWVYIGAIGNGDNSGATGDIMAFNQVGNLTLFSNAATGNVLTQSGTRLATTASATSLTFSYAQSTATTSGIPLTATFGYYAAHAGSAGSGTTLVQNAGGNYPIFQQAQTATMSMRLPPISSTGIKITASNAVGMDIFLYGFIDGVLGVGFNPQL